MMYVWLIDNRWLGNSSTAAAVADRQRGDSIDRNSTIICNICTSDSGLLLWAAFSAEKKNGLPLLTLFVYTTSDGSIFLLQFEAPDRAIWKDTRIDDLLVL